MLRLIFGLMLALVLSPAMAQSSVQSCAPTFAGSSCAISLPAIAGTQSITASNVVLKSTPGIVVGFQVNNTSSSSRWLFLFNGTAAPSNGAIVGCSNTSPSAGCISKYYQLAGNTGIGVTWSPGPFLRMSFGAVLACSSTGPYTLTLATDCTFSAEIN